MGRWRKGTTDHDGDGRMGGSNPKGKTMTTKKKTEAPKVEATEEHGVNAAGKVDKNLDADGKAVSDQEGAAARLATMTPTRRNENVGQVETASGGKK